MRLCREVNNPSLSQISQMLKKDPGAIEPGLTIIDGDLVIPTVGEIDLVAASADSLLFISIFIHLTAEDLGKAAGIKKWMEENSELLKQEYAAKGKKLTCEPRIIFLCAGIDPYAFCLLPLLNNLPLDVMRYRSMQAGQDKWLTIEKIIPKEFPEYEVGLPRRAKNDFVQSNPFEKYKPAELTAAEINDFFVPQSNEEDLDFSGPYFTKTY